MNENPTFNQELTQGTVTRILWEKVSGLQLEELLYGLLDAMGANRLVWRAGSTSGITASDGGRDLEAVFDRPGPDGELDRQTWWTECKGRSSTVERGAVQQAVLDASARAELDVLVVATNSRFSNPTRDWVDERTRAFARPMVRLWDRDQLDRLVQRYPTVAARYLPNSLSDEERLRMLVMRFQELGEEPTALDLQFFWKRRDWLTVLESSLLSEAVAMFLYAEGIQIPRQRPWWQLLTEPDTPAALVTALVNLPSWLGKADMARPLESMRVWAASSRILNASLLLLPEDLAAPLTCDIWEFVTGGEEIKEDSQQLQLWHDSVLIPALAFARNDLLEPCAQDCSRVTADSPHEVNSLGGVEVWDLLVAGGQKEPDSFLVIESLGEPCTVGADVSDGCPLVVSNKVTPENIVQSLQRVLKFRKETPDGAADKNRPDSGGGVIFTVLENHGMAWRSNRHGDEAG
ncbi:restriction endonuclease [Streptomyces sp. NPDC002181]|uniref:restriction endonuclease n=1 Tax=Streptomyces sp. NPDC002181 TaxID=3364635 RepID=UPI0036C4327D